MKNKATATQINLQMPLSNQPSVLMKAVELLRKKPLLVLYLSDEILLNDDCILPLYQQLQTLKPLSDLDVFLYSRGGTTETPWKIVSLIREFSERFSVIIPYRAHSAATHIALGANEIVMGPISELSPVDPTRMHPLLPTTEQGDPIPVSVQDLRHCLSFLRQEFKREYSDEAFAKIYTKLFEYINPLALGAIEQSYRLARLISYKILTTRLDPENDQKNINRIIEYLSARYQSHSYPISRKEAKEELGLPVIYPESTLWGHIWNLFCYYREQTTKLYHSHEQKNTLSYIGFIDTTKKRTILSQQISEEEQPKATLSWLEFDYEA